MPKGSPEPELFIGGPSDGEWKTILYGGDQAVIVDPERSPVAQHSVVATSTTYRTVMYKALSLACGAGHLRVWAPADWKADKIIRRLVDGYSAPRASRQETCPASYSHSPEPHRWTGDTADGSVRCVKCGQKLPA